MFSKLKVLVYGSSENFLRNVPSLIQGLRIDCLVASEPEGGRALLSHHTCAAIVAEVRRYDSGGSQDLGFLRAVRSANPGLRVIILRRKSDKTDEILRQFIVETRNVVLIPAEQSEGLLAQFFEEIVGAERALESEEFSVQQLIPIEEHIRRGVLTSHYQPIFILKTLDIYAYEALARSQTGGLLNHPGVLFEYAANKTMFAAIDYACTEAALRDSETLFDDQMLFLNVQPRSMTDVDFPEILEFQAAKFGRSPQGICIELTEQEGFKNARLFETTLAQFRDRGFRIAVDDFGEGNANFEMLMHTNPDVVKVSGKIVAELQRLPTARRIITSLISLCKDLEIQTVAEFIETEAQLEILTDLGIDYGQGWHLGRPCNAADLRQAQLEHSL